MSAAGQSPAQDAPLPAAVQARIDQLFRHHLREDPAIAATTAMQALRRYIETYRGQAATQAGVRP